MKTLWIPEQLQDFYLSYTKGHYNLLCICSLIFFYFIILHNYGLLLKYYSLMFREEEFEYSYDIMEEKKSYNIFL